VLQGRRNVCIWHKADMLNALTNVCFNKAKGPWVALAVEHTAALSCQFRGGPIGGGL
jgi:hypothetical protein